MIDTRMKMTITYTTSYHISFNRFFTEGLRLKEKDRLVVSIDENKTFIQFHKASKESEGCKISLNKGNVKIYNKKLIQMIIECLSLRGLKFKFSKSAFFIENEQLKVRFLVESKHKQEEEV